MLRSRLRGSTPVSQWLSGGGGVRIKSIQRGTITLNGVASNTATITAVATTNTELVYLGCSYDTDVADEQQYECRVMLTNATTVTANRGGTSGTAIASFEVIEYATGVLRSVQRGTISLSGATSNTATVSAVDTTRCRLTSLGTSDTSGAPQGFGSRFRARLALTNATTITATKGVANDTTTVAYQLLEFN